MDDRKEALTKVSAERWRIALILSVCMLAIYFGFILLIAFDKPLMGSILTPGLKYLHRFISQVSYEFQSFFGDDGYNLIFMFELFESTDLFPDWFRQVHRCA